MKKVLITLNVVCFIVVAGVFSTFAQNSGPVFEADNMTVDFGEVRYQGDGVREFHFKNTGSAPLMITNAKGSCGCTVPEWPKEPIRPGTSGIIKIKYDTKRQGPISKTVTVTTNEVNGKDDSGNPIYKTHVVQVKGLVKKAPNTNGIPTKTNTTGVPME